MLPTRTARFGTDFVVGIEFEDRFFEASIEPEAKDGIALDRLETSRECLNRRISDRQNAVVIRKLPRKFGRRVFGVISKGSKSSDEHRKTGAQGGTRTHTVLLPKDFKSSASTISPPGQAQ